jgi:competence ComEA-like helix-hairpin-helix protein
VGKDDRRAVAVLLTLAALGLVVRFGPLARRGTAPGAVAYRSAEPRLERDSVAARALRLARPLAKGETVDLDRAPAEEIARLPRIGPALAARIVDDRETSGPFGSLEGLDRVSGVGPGLLAAIKSYASFSGQAQSTPLLEPGSAAHPARRSAAAAPSGVGERGRGFVSLNTATEAELAQLPGIGPARAAAIVAHRKRHGPYSSVEDLGRVPGIGPVTIERLRSRVRVP